MKIGVFDSGFGGLDIFSHIIKVLPEYDFVYLGDTARTPYGSRSQETIYKYATEATDFLFSKDCQLVIFACNSASAKALRKIQQEYLPNKLEKLGEEIEPPSRRVLGVVIPAIEEAIKLTKSLKIGVIGTESTIDSGAFVEEIRKKDERITVFQKACPLLVPIIESEESHSEIIDSIIENYLSDFIGTEIDVLILGCTHYGILKTEIEKVLKRIGVNVKIVSEGEVVARKIKEYLNRHPEIENKLSKNKKNNSDNCEFYTTDLTLKFQKIGSRLVGKNIDAIKVNLG